MEEKPMERKNSRNRRTLQRLAADLMMEGISTREIASRLGIKLDTLLRWQDMEIFTKRIALHKAVIREELRLDLVRAIRQTGRFATENPNGKLTTFTMLSQVIKLANMIGNKD